MTIPDDAIAEAWCSQHWQDLFPDLGSYDFAREAFKAGAKAERERILSVVRVAAGTSVATIVANALKEQP